MASLTVCVQPLMLCAKLAAMSALLAQISSGTQCQDGNGRAGGTVAGAIPSVAIAITHSIRLLISDNQITTNKGSIMNEDTQSPSSPDLFEDEASYTIYYDPSMAAGSWSNHTNVMYSMHEFTIDFVRTNIEGEDTNDAVLVHRANVSPWTAMNLADQLQDCIEAFSQEFINNGSESEQDLKAKED